MAASVSRLKSHEDPVIWTEEMGIPRKWMMRLLKFLLNQAYK